MKTLLRFRQREELGLMGKRHRAAELVTLNFSSSSPPAPLSLTLRTACCDLDTRLIPESGRPSPQGDYRVGPQGRRRGGGLPESLWASGE